MAVKYGKGALRGPKRQRLGGKWWTPDVVGIAKLPKGIRTLGFTPEIIAAEIKTATDGDSVISGFGQACAYQVFSHKTYLVVPKESDNLDRLVALCDIFGIGLVLFTSNKDKPDFDIRARARANAPNPFYVSRFFQGMADTVREALGVRRDEDFSFNWRAAIAV